MKLFEIANEYQNILEETFDAETGEINQNALSKLDEITVDIKEKGIAVASFIKNIDAEREAISNAKKSMADRESKLNRRVDYLTSYLQANMERCGINEMSCAYFTVKLKKCPASVFVIDEKDIPDEYKKKKEEISLDKVKLKEHIQAGVVVPGASLKQNLRLEIR